jgi:hypothetical protein
MRDALWLGVLEQIKVPEIPVPADYLYRKLIGLQSTPFLRQKTGREIIIMIYIGYFLGELNIKLLFDLKIFYAILIFIQKFFI